MPGFYLFICLSLLVDSEILKLICHIFSCILKSYCPAHSRCSVNVKKWKKSQCLWSSVCFGFRRPLWTWALLVPSSWSVIMEAPEFSIGLALGWGRRPWGDPPHPPPRYHKHTHLHMGLCQTCHPGTTQVRKMVRSWRMLFVKLREEMNW